MDEQKNRFLALAGTPPARVTADETAWLLGCQPHDIPILVSRKLLKPLGNPPPNAVKYFSTVEVTEKTRDRAWLMKMTQEIGQHWRERNTRRRIKSAGCKEEDARCQL